MSARRGLLTEPRAIASQSGAVFLAIAISGENRIALLGDAIHTTLSPILSEVYAMQSPSSPHCIDQELEDTFPASDPPSMSAPSIATTTPGPVDTEQSGGWIDLYRIETADALRDAHTSVTRDEAVLAQATSELRFGTSAALALLHYLVEQGVASDRVRLVRVRAELTRISTHAPIGDRPPMTSDASFIADTRTKRSLPGRFIQSTLSPADREVIWEMAHDDSGELRVISETIFLLDPQLLELRGLHKSL